jgi:peptidyl-prolyl cis-trans isomerase B (cyclophilin B)
MKKKVVLFVLLLLIFPFFVACDSGEKDIFSEKIRVNIEVNNYGTMELELYPDVAPITVDNFVSLVKKGFYDGLTFHRIMDGFMIQGGDPTGTGQGGLDKKIKGEFLANGIENDLKHERGVISMARAGSDYNSASCQFFIVHKDRPDIDGHYAAFGKVIKGIEVVDQIVKNTKVEDSNGKVLKENQPVINKIYLVK